MFNKTIVELAQLLQSKQISSAELTEIFLSRIEADKTNSFISITKEIARTQAKQADLSIAKGESKLLTGIPIAHKDIFCTEGVKTSCGSKILDNFIAPYESTVSAKLKQAGTVMLGKTNMDEFAMGSTNESSYYGVVKNCWNLNKVPGGSSGGSGVAVAARLAVASTGTDTGGSIRLPASMCGITGIKPTYGAVSRYGMIAYASSLDQGGPLTKTAHDAAIMLNSISGFDHKDSTSAEIDHPDFTKNLNSSLEGIKIGVPKEFFSKDLNHEIAKVINRALQQYEKLGAKLIDISLPNTALAIPTYYVLASAECSSNLSRFDGVRFGYRTPSPIDLEDLYKLSRGEGFGKEVKRRIMTGTYVLSAGYYDAYYLKAQKIRHIIADDYHQALKKVDVIMGPVSPDITPDIGSFKDPIAMYLSDIYTLAVNLAGLPAMSIPAGFAHNMPVGLHIIGDNFSESKLLNIAHKFQLETDWHQQTPSGNHEI